MTNRYDYLCAKATEALLLAELADPNDKEGWRELAAQWLSMVPADLRAAGDPMGVSAKSSPRISGVSKAA